MLTVCPKCALSLAVTAADLRVGQGYVRCGRCSSVFNALVALAEDPAQRPAVPPRAPTAEDSLEFTLGSEEIERIFVTASPDDPEVGTGTFESIVLEGDALGTEALPAETSSPVEAADEVVTVMDVVSAPSVAQSQDPAPAGAAREESAPQPDELHRYAGRFDAANEEEIRAATATTPRTPASEHAMEPEATLGPSDTVATAPRFQRIAMVAGAVLLALMLVFQWVHWRRNELATRPALHGFLTGFYAGIGSPLAPNWDAAAYEVVQRGASTDAQARGRLLVRASLKNGADRAQPLPLLRLTLHDRYGTLVAARDLEPREYVSAPAHAERMLGPGQRIDTEIALLDPGRSAVGFELDACFALEGGAVRCAGDAGGGR